MQYSYRPSCNLITTSSNQLCAIGYYSVCKSISTLVASKITDELNCRDQMQIVHIVITSCNSIIYKVEIGGTHRCNHIKEIKYIDIGYSFVKHIFMSKTQQMEVMV